MVVVSTWPVLSDVLLLLKCDYSDVLALICCDPTNTSLRKLSNLISPYMVVQLLNMAAPLITTYFP